MVLELSAHIARLAESARLMGLTEDTDQTSCIDQLRAIALHVLGQAIHGAEKTTPTQHLKLTLLLYPSYTHDHAPSLVLDCHVQPLPSPPPPPIIVQLGGAPRSNAHAKDSAWVEARRGLLASQRAGVHETVLVGVEDGLVYEGLSSNVFAVMVSWCMDISHAVVFHTPSLLSLAGGWSSVHCG